MIHNCDNCALTITEVILLCQDDTNVKNFLISHKLILNKRQCPKCGDEVPLNWELKRFRCQSFVVNNKRKRKRCQFFASCFQGTFGSRTFFLKCSPGACHNP